MSVIVRICLVSQPHSLMCTPRICLLHCALKGLVLDCGHDWSLGSPLAVLACQSEETVQCYESGCQIYPLPSLACVSPCCMASLVSCGIDKLVIFMG